MENIIELKTTSNGSWHPMEENLQKKNTFSRRRPPPEDDIHWKMTAIKGLQYK